ncbi:MAG: MBL fold metallo-hydrolase RNA specificity domain-containing protein [Sandaracinaceae bacterium]
MIHVDFLGAAGTVTGSMHRVRTSRATVLLDCGMYQGRRAESIARNRTLPFEARDIDACVLSHAHIDHSGRLPVLGKAGYRGTVFGTPATLDLCTAMLEDSAHIQQSDARYLNRRRDRDPDSPPVVPIYEQADVDRILAAMQPVRYRHRVSIADGVDVTLLDAGHVLGSAIVVLDIDDDGATRRVVFTGDLGRRNMPILRDPEVPGGAEVLLMESTYGDRTHAPVERMDDELAAVVTRTVQRGGKVIVPSFALERAQEVVYALSRLKVAGRLPKVPVYVDSPLTVRLTDVFRRHPDCYDAELSAVASKHSPFDFPALTYVSSVEDSKRLTASSAPAVVISASGMCENGRVVHHLRAALGDRNCTVAIVGWQAQHTLGRRLVEGRTRVRVFGVERERRCEVAVLDGFSAHADRDDLVDFAEAVRERGPLRHIALVHGEPPSQRALRQRLRDRGFPSVHLPEDGDSLSF